LRGNKTYRLFQSLSSNEIKELKRESKASVTLPLVSKLFALLCRQHPVIDISLEGKQKLFKKLYPGQDYSDVTIRRLLSEINKFIIDYLCFKKLYEDEWERNFRLMQIYEKGKLYQRAHRLRQQLHSYLDLNFTESDRFFKKKILLYQSELNSLNPDTEMSKEILREKICETSDRYFAFVKMRLAVLIKSRAKIVKTDDFVSFLPVVKTAYCNGFLEQNQLFNLYHFALQLTDGEEEIFSEYERIYFSMQSELAQEENLLLFYTGLNYIIRQVNHGNREKYGKVAFKWYKSALESNILIINNGLSTTTFSNIVSFGCRAHAIDWTLSFISAYLKYLPPSTQKDEEKYSRALVYFQIKDFKKSVTNLTDYSFSQKYLLKTKLLLIRSYFEIYFDDTEYYQLLLNNIAAFESFLNRNKTWPQKAKVPYINSCRVMKKIAKKRNKLMSLEQILLWYESEMEKEYPITGKMWLLDTLKQNRVEAK